MTLSVKMKFFEWQSRWLKKDITGLNCVKGASGKVIVDDKGIKDSWKEYSTWRN